MKGRYRAFLRATSNVNRAGQKQINLPTEVLKEMEWGINDSLKVDIIKSGMHHSISIAKEEE